MIQRVLGRCIPTLKLQRSALTRPISHAFSSQANANVDGNPQNRVPKTIYRQLLGWCRRYDDVPFKALPPVTLSPPQVNHAALKRLKEMRSFLSANGIEDSTADADDGRPRFGQKDHPAHYAMYGEDVVVKEDMITFPEITDACQLRAIIRSIYWLNNERTIANIEGVDTAAEEKAGATKEQISLAFEALKSCNQLASTELDSRRSKREFNIKVRREQAKESSEGEEFPCVKYHVGQVVKHKDRWRGVIVGWTIEKDKNDDGRRSSLTTKQYSLQENETLSTNDTDKKAKSKVKYTVLVDYNDANLIQSSKTVSLESQEDLSPVNDPCLQRVHNNSIKTYFKSFDIRGHFVPNTILAYIYPLDRFSHCKFGCAGLDEAPTKTTNAEPKQSPELEQSILAIKNGVQEISRRLLVPLSESNTQQEETDDKALSMIKSLRLDVQSMSTDNPSSNPISTAVSSLAKLYNFHVKINALIWTRNSNQKHKEHIEFSLGQIVKHKLYGFRGMVTGWDAKPKMDVSNWDGLQDIVNPQEKPFYHVYADVNDCISAFGGPRDYRYVCQDNMELSQQNEKLEFVFDLDPEEWKWDGERGVYIPSAEMKFMFAEDLGEHEPTLIANLQSLKMILAECLLEVCDGSNTNLFSMDDLFCQLQIGAENLEDATIVQDLIREIWKESPNCDLRDQLDNGIAEMIQGKNQSALDKFNSIVKSDPLYGEAWNKKATVHYLLGQVGESIKSAEEALKIDNRNFQALAGMGLIEMDNSNYDKAIGFFRKCLDINPWLITVSARLFLCISKRDNGTKVP